MHGEGSIQSEILLTEGKFAKESIDKFTVDCWDNFSPLTGLDVGYDNSGMKFGWYLDKVC